jgi:hypothetical protein
MGHSQKILTPLCLNIIVNLRYIFIFYPKANLSDVFILTILPGWGLVDCNNFFLGRVAELS